MWTRTLIGVATIALAGLVVLRAQEPATQPTPAQVLSAQMVILQNATDIRTAMAAYARGSFVAPDDVALQQAMLSKALQLNYPEMAYLPAGVLARLNKADGLTLAVLAQMQAKAGLYIDALQDIVKAVDADASNDYVIARSAELLAWYDRQPSLPGISDALQGDLERARLKIENTGAFHAAYESSKTLLASGVTPSIQTATIMDQPTTQSCDQIVVQLNNDMRRLRRTVDQLRGPSRNIGSQFYGPSFPNVAVSQVPGGASVPPVQFPTLPNYGSYYIPPTYNPNQGYFAPYMQAPLPFGPSVILSPSTGGGGSGGSK